MGNIEGLGGNLISMFVCNSWGHSDLTISLGIGLRSKQALTQVGKPHLETLFNYSMKNSQTTIDNSAPFNPFTWKR